MYTSADERFVLENAVVCGIKQPKEVYIEAIIASEDGGFVACQLTYHDVIGVGVWIKEHMSNIAAGKQIALTEAMKDVATKFNEKYVL